MNDKTESPYPRWYQHPKINQSVEASWNPFDPDFLINPYPQYELLRDQDPVHRTAFGNLVVTRFDDVSEVLRNPNTSVERDRAGMIEMPEHIKKLRESSIKHRKIGFSNDIKSWKNKKCTAKNLGITGPKQSKIVNRLLTFNRQTKKKINTTY